MSTDLVQHAFHGQAVRVIADEHGEPWFVLADLCAVLGLARVAVVAARIDDDMKGVCLADTPGGRQQMTTVSEPGMYEVVLRSDSVLARPFRRWITTELLPEIRRTGSYAAPQSREQRLAIAVLDAQAMLAEKDEQIAILAPSARSWDVLADSVGDYSLRDAAQILDRDPAIRTGQNRLGRYLRQIGWTDSRSIPYQSRVDQGLLCSRARSYSHPRSGETVVAEPQIRITAKGLGRLHTLLGGTEPVDVAVRHLTAVG